MLFIRAGFCFTFVDLQKVPFCGVPALQKGLAAVEMSISNLPCQVHHKWQKGHIYPVYLKTSKPSKSKCNAVISNLNKQ